jgi:hypothetical protein
MQEAITNLLSTRDAYISGFADKGWLLRDNYPFRYAVVVGAKLNDVIIDGIESAPAIDYFNILNHT